MTATVNADLFRIVAGFVSTEETRYYLKGVFIHAHPVAGVYMVATDGHRLMIAHDETGTTTLDGVIVALDKATLAATKCAARGENHPRSLEIHGHGEVRVLAGDPDERRPVAIQHRAIVDGTFPDYRRVIPTPADAGAPWFNPAYLQDFAKAAQEIGKLRGQKDAAFRVTGASDMPALVQFLNASHIFGVLMPIRGPQDVTLPSWLDAQPEQALMAAE
ncbi:hypothetical protein [Rhizobium sp. 18065]|uniref:hypothetical protein n=1 Tax=Rhizobium sp. 18065 TaxID=2681411 RepID=UPI001358FBFC|nr:hypothetical protein [Rhizobium sp. 18065]